MYVREGSMRTIDISDFMTGDDSMLLDYTMLRQAYREDSDSPPNQKANETIGPLFVDFVMDAVQSYREKVER